METLAPTEPFIGATSAPMASADRRAAPALAPPSLAPARNRLVTSGRRFIVTPIITNSGNA